MLDNASRDFPLLPPLRPPQFEVRPMMSETRVAPVRVLERAVYRGPHYFSATPMIRMRLDLGALEDWPSDRLPGFADALLASLPGLAEHHCSRGHKGGFVERLREGTWLGHVSEHVALQLQQEVGHDLRRGKTRQVRGEHGRYNVVFGYVDENVGIAASRLAVRLINHLVRAEPDFDFET